jgi:transcriptional regulator with XRE-family HTH domain
VKSSDLIRMARSRSGLSQEELAVRSGRPRSTIARWESGARSPSLESLEEVIGAAGLDLTVSLTNRDTSLHGLVADQLALTPEDRLRHLLPADQAKSLAEVLGKLAGMESPSVVIGSIAGALQGAPQRPRGDAVEVGPRDRDGFLQALESLGGTATDDERRFDDVDRRWRWAFGPGYVDVVDRLVGASGYRDLNRTAVPVRFDEHDLRVAATRDLLRLAEASPAEGDGAYVPGLRALLEVESKSARI